MNYFKMKFSSVLLFLFVNLMTLYSFVKGAEFNLMTYDSKICASEPTCNLTSNPQLSAERLTLIRRDCMCDADCVEYADCCKDSQYFGKVSTSNKKYVCPTTKGANYYMIYSCAANYTDEKIKTKCAKALLPLKENDFAISIPVTNKAKRCTYANAYCALCNYETDFEKWTTEFGCADPPEGYFDKKAAEVKSTQSQTSSNSNSKSDNKVKLNIHFNPTSIFTGNKNESAGLNKEINIPNLVSSKIVNKTIGSSTGLFGVKISKSKRQTDQSKGADKFNFSAYASKVNELLKIAKYNSTVGEITANYNGKQLYCRLNFTVPKSFNNSVRRCVQGLISECSTDKNNQCKSYFQVVYEPKSRKAYQNKECAICNGVDSSLLKGCDQSERAGPGSGLFSSEGKVSTDNGACENESLASKFC